MTAPPTFGRPLRAAAIGFAALTTTFVAPGVAPASAAPLTGIDLSTYVREGRYNLPEPTRTTPPEPGALLAQEASGVAYNPDTDTLFIAGDGSRSVTQVTKTGQLVDSMTLPVNAARPRGVEFDDTEGITYIGNGEFVMTEEREQKLVRFTYVPNTTLQRSATKTVTFGANVGNVGLEGVTYDKKTGGFIVVKEKDPLGIFATTVDWDAGTVSNNSTNLFDPALVGTSDLSDVYSLANVNALNGTADADNLVIISQEAGKVVEIDRSGVIKSSFTLVKDADNPLSIPDQTQEGVTVDEDGKVYVVSEEGGGDIDHPQLWVFAPATSANAAPTAVALTAPTASLPENTNTTTRVKVAGIAITDDGQGTNQLAVTGPDAASFEVDATGLYLKAGTALSHATKPSYSVSVTVDDATVGSTPDATSSAYTLSVDAVTAAPASASLAITEVAPWGSGAGTAYGADWWEVTNTGTTRVDLTGWKVDDSSAAFGSAVALNGVSVLAPGESAIFIEGDATKATAFTNAWFPGGPPAGFKIGTYAGSGIGLSTDGDQVNLYDGTGTRITGVAFGASTTGKSFDNTAALGSATSPVPAITALSAAGTNGAFTVGAETGSPGAAAVPTPLAVTEVAPWGSDDSVYAADFWELTNTSAQAVDLTGFKVDDSSNAFASAAALTGVSTLAPGQSAIFLEGNTTKTAAFTSAWFGNSVPAGFQIGYYSGSGIGLSGGGDAVNVFNATGDRVTGISFGAATNYRSFDNHAGVGSFTLPLPVVSALSTVGQFGAFLAHDQIASPGRISNPTIGKRLEATAVTFASQAAGTTGVGQWVTATNTGDAAVTISRVAIRETNDESAGDFLLSADRCTGELLAPGATCKVQVRFAPGRENAASAAELRFTSDAAGSPTVVALAATSTGLPAGPKGDAGAAGPKGDTGAAGPKGDAGAAGPKGDTGAAGAVGPKGDAGAAGTKGDTGATGPQGPKGDKGDKGDPGSLAVTVSASKTAAGSALKFRVRNTGLSAVRGAKLKVTLPKGLRAARGTSATFTSILPTKSGSVSFAVRRARGAARTQTITVQVTVGKNTETRKVRVTV